MKLVRTNKRYITISYESSERTRFVDIAKGIGIILVVLGHLSEPYMPNMVKWIFSFHMPLFFVLSGYLKGTKKVTNFKVYAKRRAVALLWPYIVFAIAIWGIAFIDSIVQDNWQIFFQSILIHIFGYSSEKYGIGVIWFLAVLFETEVIFAWIEDKKKAWIYLIFVLIGILLLHFRIIIPIYLNIVVISVPFFAFGHTIKNVIDRSKELKLYFLALIVILVLFLSVLSTRMNGKVNLAIFDSGGNIVYFYLGALSGTLFVIGVSIILDRLEVGGFLERLGQETLVIMMAHFFVNRFLNVGFGILGINLNVIENGLGSMLQSFINIFICYNISILVKIHAMWMLRFPYGKATVQESK